MLNNVKMVIVDVDGVLTDGRIILDANGIESKAFYVQDGTAITYLHRAGIKTAIISGRESNVFELRAEELCIEDGYLGIHNK